MAIKKPTPNNDKIIGTAGNDSINGLAGNDTLIGQSGKDTLLGGTGNDSLEGGVGNDSLLGGAGRDTLMGGSDHDYLAGEADDDLLDGGAGNDTLDGGTGADTLIGGDGNDTYIVDNSRDRIVENSGRTSGTDSVKSSVDYVLPANVENLELTGLNPLKATGSDGKNMIVGNAGDNWLDGKNGFDTLMGGEGDDTLLGGGGIDKLIGGDGSDTYQVSSKEDIIVETARDGDQDVIETSVSYELGDNLEVLVLTGTGNIDGTGNDVDNTLVGNDADNHLSGAAGSDVINGDGGNDTLDGGEGDDTIDGGDGTDEVEYQGNKDSYNILFDPDSNTWVVEDVNSDGIDEGTDEITNVEVLRFADSVYDPTELNKPTISIADLSQAEGTGSNPTSFNFTVSLSAPATAAVSVDYRLVNGTAQADVDFVDVSGTVEFAPGETSQTLSVPVFADSTPELDKTFTVQLANPVGADLGDTGAIATGTIRDDDKVELSITNLEVSEGDAGSKNALVTVSLGAASLLPVTVNYSTTNGTATASSDYISKNGTLTFMPGVTQQTIPISILGDKATESDETFFVNLNGAKNATLNSTLGKSTVTIKNDDSPTLSINNVSQLEGSNGNSQDFNFTVKLSSPAASTVSVDYQVQGGSATDGVDFFGSRATLVFQPGQTTQTIPVTVVADNESESSETFSVQLTNAQGVKLDSTASRGTGTILDDDRPQLSISGTQVMEGNGTSTNAVLTVNLSTASTQTVTVNYSTISGSAQASSDFMAKSGTVSFAPGVTSQDIQIQVLGDTLTEPDENFSVVLSNTRNADLDDNASSATVVITNDDAPAISISGGSVVEGSGSANNVMQFTVKLSNASSVPVTVDYQTQGINALMDQDFVSTSSTLTFAAGQQVQTIRVPVIADNIPEGTETFSVSLSNPKGASLDYTANSATGSITDDDKAELSISDVQIMEGNPGDNNTAVLTVNLSAPTSQKISVSYNTVNGTATGFNDYTGKSGIVTFDPGSTRQEISIPIMGDQIVEPDETFFVQLLPPQNASISSSAGKAKVTITNDDAPTLSITGTSIKEGNSGTKNAVLTVNLSSPSAQAVTVDYSSLDGSAQSGIDFQPVQNTLYFAPGVVTQQIKIPVYGDTEQEPDESFGVVLTNASNAVVSDTQGQANVIISNDDTSSISTDIPLVFIPGDRQVPLSVAEGATAVTLNVQLSKVATVPVSVGYATADFMPTSAQAGADYKAVSETLTFQPGETMKSISIPIIGDTAVEGLERFMVNLNNPRGARFPSSTEESWSGGGSKEVDILDDDSSTVPPVSGTGGTVKFHLYQGRWYNTPDHNTQAISVSTVTSSLRNGPTIIEIDGLDTPGTPIQINGWTPDDKLVFNTQPDDVQKVAGAAKTLADTDLGILYGRHYTTTKTTSFGNTTRIQRVTGVLWQTTTKGTAHWIVYGTAEPSDTAYPVTPNWVDGIDKTLAKINPATGVYGDYIQASDISFI